MHFVASIRLMAGTRDRPRTNHQFDRYRASLEETTPDRRGGAGSAVEPLLGSSRKGRKGHPARSLELVSVMSGRSAPFIPESLAIALGNHRRLRILVAMLEGPASATALRRGPIPDLSVDSMDYHLKELNAVGAIRLLDSRKVRGATKHTYRLSESWKSLVGAIATFDPQTSSNG